MPDFRPFRLGEAISEGQGIAMNQFNLGETLRGAQSRSAIEGGLRTGDLSSARQQFPMETQLFELEQQDLLNKMDLNQIKAATAKIEFGTQLLAGTKDEESYQQARQIATQNKIDTSKWPANFDPNFIATSIEQGITVKQRLEANQKNKEEMLKRDELKVKERASDIAERRAGAAETTAAAAMKRADAAMIAAEGKNAPGKRFDVELEKHAAKQYAETIEAAPKIAEQGDISEQALAQFLDYSKNKIGGTGPLATGFGLTQYTSEETQKLEATFKTVNLKNMVSTFQGMSRAIDSDAERRAWEHTQPGIKLDDEVNAQILVGNIALSKKSLAEAEARRSYMEDKGSLKGYESPVIGKIAVMFGSDGKAQLIDKEKVREARKQGFLTTDQYAKRVLKGGLTQERPSETPSRESLPPKNDKGWVLHKDAQGNKAYIGPNNEVEEVR